MKKERKKKSKEQQTPATPKRIPRDTLLGTGFLLGGGGQGLGREGRQLEGTQTAA
jgi:hypothetical protein